MTRKIVEEDKRSRDFFEGLFVALIAALILRALVVQAFRIPTGSMKDTLLIGDFLLVNKFIYGIRTPEYIPLIHVKLPYAKLPGFKKPKRGDIVVFKYPLDTKLDYIKRCVAVAGQTVEVRIGIVIQFECPGRCPVGDAERLTIETASNNLDLNMIGDINNHVPWRGDTVRVELEHDLGIGVRDAEEFTIRDGMTVRP